MKRLYLLREDSDEVNVVKIIEFIRNSDMLQGLTLEQVQYKYTHGFCRMLAELVNEIFKHVLAKSLQFEEFFFKSIENGKLMDDCHVYIKIPPVAENEECKYIDIFGLQTKRQVKQMLSNKYIMEDIEELKHIQCGATAELIFEITEEMCWKFITAVPPEKELE